MPMDRWQLEQMKQQGIQQFMELARQKGRDDLAARLNEMNVRYKQQQIDSLANKDAREAELHPLAVRGKEQDIEIKGAKEGRDAEEYEYERTTMRPLVEGQTKARTAQSLASAGASKASAANSYSLIAERKRKGTLGEKGKAVSRRDYESALRTVNEVKAREADEKTGTMDTDLYDSAWETVVAYREQALPQQYPPAKYEGKSLTDGTTKYRYYSDGTSWRRIIQSGN